MERKRISSERNFLLDFNSYWKECLQNKPDGIWTPYPFCTRKRKPNWVLTPKHTYPPPFPCVCIFPTNITGIAILAYWSTITAVVGRPPGLDQKPILNF